MAARATPKRLSAKRVAEYFIWKSAAERRPLTNKKLQKLLYYSQAWSLVLRNKRLFPERIEAWVHGPAIRSVYSDFKKFGFDPITDSVSADEVAKIPTEVKTFLDQVWAAYGKYDAAYLEHMTHLEQPWQKAREGIEAHVGSDIEITTDSMKEFYSARLEAARRKK